MISSILMWHVSCFQECWVIARSKWWATLRHLRRPFLVVLCKVKFHLRMSMWPVEMNGRTFLICSSRVTYMKCATKKQLTWCHSLYISMKLVNNAMLGCMCVTYTDICKHIMFTVPANHHGTCTSFQFHETTVRRKLWIETILQLKMIGHLSSNIINVFNC